MKLATSLAVVTFGLLWLGGLCAQQTSNVGKEPFHVCTLVEAGRKHDGRVVEVTGLLMASFEGTRLQEEGCGKTIFVVYPAGVETLQSREFERIMADQMSLVRREPVLVTLKGIFHSRVAFGSSRIQQIVVTQVIELKTPK